MQELKDIKWLLQKATNTSDPWYGSDVGAPFNTNILRIALNTKEEKIAQ